MVQKVRYGKHIQGYQIKSNFVMTILLVIAIILIPLQIFLETILEESENRLIVES